MHQSHKQQKFIEASLVNFSHDGRIGLIEINNPPVNALSVPLVQALIAALSDFEAVAGLQALVLYSAGRTWVAGADIATFDDPGFPVVEFNAFLERLEAQPCHIVAALRGAVLGGGLELAMACHHRIAEPNTRLGLPEVKIGMIPGAQGTQRLPRLVGTELALEMITSGRVIDAAQAQAAGLVDAVAEGDPRSIGLAVAEALLASGAAPRRASALAVAPAPEAAFAMAEAAAAKKPGWPQLAAAIRCVRAAQNLPFAQGKKIEADEFAALVNTPSAKSLRHLFFAEREAVKIPGLSRNTPRRPINTVGIVGSGTMGGGIALAFLNAGIPVRLLDISEEALQRGLGLIRGNYEASADKGRLTARQVEQRMELLQGSLDDQALTDCDLIIEAVYEDLQLKTEVCTRLGAVAKPGAIIATNTSTLDVDQLAQATGRPADVLGMHFFSPTNVMRLLEVVRGSATAADVLTTVLKLANTIGKVPVVSGMCYGFIGNRMAEVYMREADSLILEGAEPAQVDAAVEALGMAMGPCRMLDMVGVDVGARTVIEYRKAGGLPDDPSYRALALELFELGRFGQKTVAGFYRYDGRKALPDSQVTEIAEALAERHGIVRRSHIAPEEIVERLLYPLINEGLKILDEGIAYRSSDIDVVWVAGYGFPDFRGGPLWMAHEIGLEKIAERLAHYAAVRGDAYGYWSLARQLKAAGATQNIQVQS